MILIASMFLVSIGYTMVIPFLPLYLLDIGVPEESIAIWTGIVFSSCFLVAGIMGPIWGKMADTRGKKQMAIRAAVLLGFSYLFCGLSQNAWQMTAARAFMGFSNGFVAASMAIISVSADPKNLGATLGMGQTALIVGGIAGRDAGTSHRYTEYLLYFCGVPLVRCRARHPLCQRAEAGDGEKGGIKGDHHRGRPLVCLS